MRLYVFKVLKMIKKVHFKLQLKDFPSNVFQETKRKLKNLDDSFTWLKTAYAEMEDEETAMNRPEKESS